MRQTRKPGNASSQSSGNDALWDQLFGALESHADASDSTFTTYRFHPVAYIRDKLGWEPWSGTEADQPGQVEVLDAYTLALRQLHERAAFEAGELRREQLQYWTPGDVIKNIIRIEAGHTVGKTKLASGLVNHFFDCFLPSIIYTFAPSWLQIHDLLWKEIKTDRSGKDLPGVIKDLELERSPNHFAKGRATNNNGGSGTERIQGQHGEYLMFVLDEAEGVAPFVFDAIDSMASGGIAIIIMLANPRTRTSRFHKSAALATTQNFRISCVWHPNVLAGRELVPGAVRREYVELMLATHCEVVEQHDVDAYTFELPWHPGTIWKPDPEFLFRVLGIAPANITDNTMIPVGRYQAATSRQVPDLASTTARMGLDVARWGADYGTLYIRHGLSAWRAAQFYHQNGKVYYQRIKDEARALAGRGVTSLHIRVDAGGGFGNGIIDDLIADVEMEALFSEFQVIEVNFGGTADDGAAYADTATEMYGEAAETLNGLAIINPPEQLEADLCERTYDWVNKSGVSVKRLDEKAKFKKTHKRSPDDGDGFVMAIAPDHIFGSTALLLW